MPVLSFVLSAVLVGAGSVYLYLSYSNKIEKSKEKIQESKKVVYIAKKSSLTLLSGKNLNTTDPFAIISATDDKLSNFVAKSDDIQKSDLELLDKCQKEVLKIVSLGKKPDENKIEPCKKLSDREFAFYSVSKDGVDIPTNSLLKEDGVIQDSFLKNAKLASFNDQIIDKQIDQFVKKEEQISKIITQNSSNTKKIKDKIVENEIKFLKKQLDSILEEKEKLDAYKQQILSTISDLKDKMNKLKEDMEEKSIISKTLHKFFNIFIKNSTTDEYNKIASTLNDNEKKLQNINARLESLEQQKQDIEQKIQQKQREKDA